MDVFRRAPKAGFLRRWRSNVSSVGKASPSGRARNRLSMPVIHFVWTRCDAPETVSDAKPIARLMSVWKTDQPIARDGRTRPFSQSMRNRTPDFSRPAEPDTETGCVTKARLPTTPCDGISSIIPLFRMGPTRAPSRVGAPGGTRTPDHLVRSQILYPTELRARERFQAEYRGNCSRFDPQCRLTFPAGSAKWRCRRHCTLPSAPRTRAVEPDRRLPQP